MGRITNVAFADHPAPFVRLGTDGGYGGDRPESDEGGSAEIFDLLHEKEKRAINLATD